MKKKPVVLTIGTFDGVHLGHQRLLAVAKRRARAIGGDVLAVAFNRPPRLFFSPIAPPYLLTTPSEKEALLRRYGADRVESIAFTRELSNLTEPQFISTFLRQRWNASEVVVGFNFRFGKGRAGDAGTLAKWGKSAGVRVHSVRPIRDREGVISSGRVRALIGAGQLGEAQELLGHAYTLAGPVVRGRGVGRRLGYPTANLNVGEDKILPSGVFAVTLTLPTGVERAGLLNVGFRPTFKDPHPQRSVEVHILDFSGDLTGRIVRLEFIKKIRDEKKFPSIKALVRQLRQDELSVR